MVVATNDEESAQTTNTKTVVVNGVTMFQCNMDCDCTYVTRRKDNLKIHLCILTMLVSRCTHALSARMWPR